MQSRLVLLLLIALAGLAIAADYTVQAGTATLARVGEGAFNTPEDLSLPSATDHTSPASVLEKPKFCGFAPCGMPLDCPD